MKLLLLTLVCTFVHMCMPYKSFMQQSAFKHRIKIKR